MDHTEWIEKELETLSLSLGFIYTPGEEIEARMKRLKHDMIAQGMDAVLVVQKMDYFYLSGTAQDALLLIPCEGPSLLMVKRELGRARLESPIESIVGLKTIRDLPAILHEHLGWMPKTLGIEMDVLPAKDYLRYRDLFKGTHLADSSKLITGIRKIKSAFEIDLMKKAGEMGRRVYLKGREILQEGMTEIEFGGRLEAVAKSYGHEGLLRVRGMNYEAYTWHVLSGPTGGIVSQSDSPMGGLGLSPVFPVGASLRVMKAHDPILVDFGTCYHGYMADETRMFSIGEMPRKFVDAYKACVEIHDSVLDATRPGADCEALFLNTLRLAEKMGYKDSYLGPPGLQTRFIGHGIGLELAEFPYLADGHAYPLEEGMTFALEPKIVFPGEGAVGIENTVVVTSNGYTTITPLEPDILQK